MEKQNAVIIDLDNTLTNAHWRSHLAQSKKWGEFYNSCDGDTVNQSIAEILLAYKAKGVEIHLYTGRIESTREKTISWMNRNNLPFDILKMRQVGNYEPDFLLKEKMLELDKYNYLHAYDDSQRNIDMFLKHDIPSTLIQI